MNPFGLTVGLSVSAHAALALIVAHAAHGPAVGRMPSAPRVSELIVVEPPAVEGAAKPAAGSAAAGRQQHTHPYPVSPDHDATPHDPSLHHPWLRAPSVTVSSAPSALEAAPAAPARFVLTVVRQPVSAGATALGASEPSDAAGHTDAAPVAESSVDSAASLLGGAAPSYTREAQEAGIETDVVLEIVVDESGRVASARSMRHVGYGLDEVAVRSVRAYRFRPAERAGRAVAVRMRWLMRFELR